ncbi:hypothetical protein CLPUN_51660 [Clostridium puniceum]|uniref:Uncharacterized protein n=1 Tax=Clostridium puniceum TaxID=29367 RepID=A0A1S8SZC4_9CLOT|nr:hypothetical protein [Clostridium puniceum]OOM70752.1 hypothetical protein CLPUN_51660 [Clostridium puniceum]
MTRENNREKFHNMMRVGNYTKHAIKNFEENIVNQKDYLEKVKENELSKDDK